MLLLAPAVACADLVIHAKPGRSHTACPRDTQPGLGIPPMNLCITWICCTEVPETYLDTPPAGHLTQASNKQQPASSKQEATSSKQHFSAPACFACAAKVAFSP